MEYDDIGRGPEIAEAVRGVRRRDGASGRAGVARPRTDPAGGIEALRDAARDEGIYAPQVAEEYGGLGLGFREMLPVFEEAGRSLLGPTALRCAAPDEGNMHTLEIAATTDAQKERWLRPLAAAEIDSGFAMTEPMQGGGRTRKCWRRRPPRKTATSGSSTATSGGRPAASRRTSSSCSPAPIDQEAHPYAGCSVILVPADADGVEVVRNIPHLGEGLVGTTHAEIRFDDVRVPVENTLGEENEGFTLVQQRLGPARLTHCMRYAGMADRALDIATAYLSERGGSANRSRRSRGRGSGSPTAAPSSTPRARWSGTPPGGSPTVTRRASRSRWQRRSRRT